MRKNTGKKARTTLLLFKTLALITFMSFGQNVYAVDPNYQILSKMFLSMKEQLKEIQESVAEAKAANETLFQVQDIMMDVKHEYEFVRNFNPERELQNVVSDFSDLTYLDELINNEGDWESKFNLLNSELDQRFNDSRKINPGGGKRYKDAKAALEKIKDIEDKRNALLLESATVRNGELHSADFQSSTASSTAVIAAMMMEQKIERMENEVRQRQKLLNEVKHDKEFLQFLGGK